MMNKIILGLFIILAILIIPNAYASSVTVSLLPTSSGGGVSGPATSTANAFSLWGGTDGKTLSNSPFLLDQSLWTIGQTATLQLPAAGANNRSWSLPNSSGPILVNSSGQSITSMFLNATNLTWFDNADPTKLMKFSMTSGFSSGKTVTVSFMSPLSGTTGSVNFPSFLSGSSSMTLLQDSGNMGGMTVRNYLQFSPQLDSGVATDANGLRLWYSTSDDTLKFKREDGSVFLVSGFKRSVVDFGSSPLTEKSFTITDSTIALNDGFVPDNTVEAQISRHTSSGKTYIDETDMDSFYVSCTPAAGSLTCLVRCLTGQVTGTFNLDYRLAGTQ